MAVTIDFTGKVVLVTGGTRGVGRGITSRFLDAGASVVVCGRNPPEAAITGTGGGEARTARFVAADVRDPDQCEALVDDIAATEGRLDVVVNNAGGSPEADSAAASPRFTEAIVRLNLIAPLLLSQAAHRLMTAQLEGGSIVNIGSVSGLRPSPRTTAYGAAKAGLENMTRSLAVEWAPAIRVNLIAGGLILTEQAELHYGDESGVAAVAATVPLGRFADPTDIGDACLFLASPLASYVTGATLLVHGGGERPAFLDARDT